MERERQVKDVIVCENLQKSFETERGKVDVIGNVNLKITENELVVLFGPGQCGKTTLINCMAGLETATAGQVTVGGKKVEGPGPRPGSRLPDDGPISLAHRHGQRGIRPKKPGNSQKGAAGAAMHYIKLVGLEGFENALPAKLSGGMQQRVGIARAYCNEPVVMFMDEPFGHLDAQTRYLMQEELVRIWEQEKRTVVFVTNNIEEAVYLADRIVVMTNCPTTVKQEFTIDLPRPRNYVDPEFLRLREEISAVVDKAQ